MKQPFKWLFSTLLVLCMCFSAVPLQTFATENVTVTAYDYLSHCTKYPTYARVYEADNTEWHVMTLPCTTAQNPDSALIPEGSEKSMLLAVAIYQNPLGYLWYEVELDNGKIGYIFSGDIDLWQPSDYAVDDNLHLPSSSIRQGEDVIISGEVTSNCLMDVISVRVEITDAEGNSQYSYITESFDDLEHTKLNDDLDFSQLCLGEARIEIITELGPFYYSEDGTTLAQLSSYDIYSYYQFTVRHPGSEKPVIDSGGMGRITWELDADGVLTIFGYGDMSELEDGSPGWHNYKNDVHKIVIQEGFTNVGWGTEEGGYAGFEEFSKLTTVVLPNSMRSIGYGTFYECINLKNINLPDGITSIGEYAFEGCESLTDIDLPDGLTRIYSGAFAFCRNLSNVIIPENVQWIDKNAFAFCDGLTAITIPASVTILDGEAFSCCKNLKKFTVVENNPRYTSDETGVIFNKNKTELICAPSGISGKYQIPSSVKSIRTNAFRNCANLTGVTIPSKVSRLNDSVFAGSGITSIIIPANITNMGLDVFYGCTELKTIYFLGDTPTFDESHVHEEDNYAFEDVVATAYYPADNTTWTNYIDWPWFYSGQFTWVPYCAIKDSAPTLKASNVASTGKIKLSWDAVEGAVKYEVWRATSKSGTYTRLTTVTSTSVTNTSATAGKTYYYKVIAIAADGTASADSNIVSRTCDLARPEMTLSNVASTGKIRIKWTEVEGAVHYEVYRADSKNGTFSLMEVVDGLRTTNVSIPAGKTYYYKVRAIAKNTAANSAFTEAQSRTCDLPQPEVTLSNVASSGKIKVSWKKIDGAVKYEVYRATAKTGSYSLIKTTTGTSMTNTSATAGRTYYYKVKALAKNSAADSARSEAQSKTCDLARPEMTLSNVASTGKIRIKWTEVEGAVHYEVYRADSANGTFSLLEVVDGLRTTNVSAPAGKTYYYKVKAIASNSAANSAFSEVQSRTCDLARPEVTLSNVASTGKIRIKWNEVEGAMHYEVYRADSSSGPFSLLEVVDGTRTTNVSAPAGKTYYYKVMAIAENPDANSAFSEVKSRTCDLARPDVSIALSSSKPKVSWEKVSGASSYKVYRATSKSGTYSLVKTTTGSYYKDTNAKSGKTYYYKVMAVHSKSTANSAYSSIVSIKSK